MKENEHLIETLREAHKDYGEGRKMDMFAVTLACKEAAAVIERQVELLNRERAGRGVRPYGRNGCPCEKASFDGYCYQEGCQERLQGETQMRLIDAGELMKQLIRAHLTYENGEEGLGYTTVCFGSAIRNAPTVDAVPVRHGHWGEVDIYYTTHMGKYKRENIHECSVCHYHFVFTVKPNHNYCPNCGAKMDEEAGK